jgi:hypothetical protein
MPFADQKQNSPIWDYSPQVMDFQDFRIIRCQIKEILLYFVVF